MMQRLKNKSGKLPEAKTREAILLAAIDEFAANGFAGARTEHIAKNAHVNKAMLHYYFHDKENLYDAVLETLYGSMHDIENLIQQISAAPLNSVQYVHAFLRIILAKHGSPSSRAFRSILAWELAAGKNNLKRVAQKYMIPRITTMTELIKRGIAAGELNCENPTFAVWSLISQVAFYYMHERTYEGSSLYDDLYGNVSQEQLLQMLLKNFIAAHAVDKKVHSALPADVDRMAVKLANLMSQPSFAPRTLP